MLRMRTFITILFLFFSADAYSSNALNLGTHYGVINLEGLSDFNIKPKGPGFHAVFSQNYGRFGLEGSFRQATYTSKVIYDQVSDILTHEQRTLGLGVYIGVNRYLLLRGGLSWTSVAHSLEKPVDKSTEMAMQNAWKLTEGTSKSSYYLGGQVKLFETNIIDLYSSYNYQKILESGSEHAFGLGLTFKFDLRNY